MKGRSVAKKKMTKVKAKMKKVMTEFSEHKLHSGSKHGPEVTNPKQAVAIAYSEAKKASHHSKPKKKHDPKPKHHSQHHEMKPTLKKDGYEMHHGHEIREMMEEHMHKAAKIKHHKSKEHAEHKPHHSKHKESLMSAKHEHSGNRNKDEESKIKQHGYKIRPTQEVRDMMEEYMHAAAKIKHHLSKGMIPAEGQDESYTGSQRPTRKNKVTDLNHGKKKLTDDPYYEVAEEDSIKSYKRAGLNKNTGADNDKESLDYARKMRVGTKKKANEKAKVRRK